MNDNPPKVSVHGPSPSGNGHLNENQNLPLPAHSQLHITDDQVFQNEIRRICQAMGRRVTEFRQKKGLTQAQLAVQSNLQIEKLAAIERGEGEFDLETLLAITKELKITIFHLVKGIA